MRREIKAVSYECDGCGKIQLVDADVDEVIGIVGSVIEHTDGGGWGGDWFACSRKCIKKAVEVAIDGRNDE